MFTALHVYNEVHHKGYKHHDDLPMEGKDPDLLLGSRSQKTHYNLFFCLSQDMSLVDIWLVLLFRSQSWRLGFVCPGNLRSTNMSLHSDTCVSQAPYKNYSGQKPARGNTERTQGCSRRVAGPAEEDKRGDAGHQEL